MVGGFSDNDGTIDFYLRVRSLVDAHSVVLDLGAGRASWFEDDQCKTRRDIRLLKGSVAKVIAADVDEIVMKNQACDERIVIKNDVLPLGRQSIDLIVADYVLEHIENVEAFFQQVDVVLKPGGWLCARTPHKYNYISILSRLVRNASHANMLRYIQPDRKSIDVFPTRYRLNTHGAIKRTFSGYSDRSFVYRSDPAYFFGSRIIFGIEKVLHGLFPKEFCGNLFIFLHKNG